MKRLVAICISVLLLVSLLAGCGNDRYYNYDITEFIEVQEYSNVVDRTSLAYLQYRDEFYNMTFGENLATEVESGKIEDGDVANIDYVGKKDGVAFSGGTASSYDLKIGSGTFIPGFEDGLIGVEIGTTVDLNLTFPEAYSNAELAGQDVVFTVTVNYAIKYADPTEADARKYGFNDLADYNKQSDEYAIMICMFNNIYQVTTFKSFPEKEETELLNGILTYYEEYYGQQGISIETLAQYNGMTLDQFKEYLLEQSIKPYMKRDLVSYYVLQIYEQPLTDKDIEATIERLREENEEPLESLSYDQIEFEQEAAFEKAKNILFQNAEVIN